MEFIGYHTTSLAIGATVSLPVKKDPNLGHTTIYSLTVLNTQAGDILTITGKTQGTNNLHKPPISTTSHNVGLGSCLTYLDNQGVHQTLTFWTGGNLDARRHHEPRWESTVWQVPANVPTDLTICFRMKSAALQAKAGWTLRVDQGYGNLRIKHERP